jgi:CBS domain-containing protein
MEAVDDPNEIMPPQGTPPIPSIEYPRRPNRFQRWRLPGKGSFSGAGFESPRYLTKWLVLSVIIGVVAGLGAAVFFSAIQWATDFFLVTLAGYTPPSPVGEGSAGLTSTLRPWLLPVVTGVGALLAGIIVFTLAPEAEGHGTDAAIDAIHHKGARIKALIPPVKLIASAITIGSGGSGGREGPTAQISAGFGSLLAGWLKLDANDRRTAVAAGMGAGIGAIFRAPLGGAVMAAEILYIHDLEVEALIPSLIASIVGYSVYGAFFGYSPIFGSQAQLVFDHPLQLVYYAMLGNNTIYSSQLSTRADSPAHRVKFSFPLLSSLLVRDALSAPGAVIAADAPLSEAQALLRQDGTPRVIAVVRGEKGDDFVGVITQGMLDGVPPAHLTDRPVSSVIEDNPVTLEPNETLQDALEKLSDSSLSWAPVVDGKHLLGRLTARNIMRVYKSTLQRSVGRARTLTDNTVMFEARVGKSSVLSDLTLREIKWPPNTLVVSVNRSGETIFPRADTKLQEDDRVMVMAEPGSEQALRTFLEGTQHTHE